MAGNNFVLLCPNCGAEFLRGTGSKMPDGREVCCACRRYADKAWKAIRAAKLQAAKEARDYLAYEAARAAKATETKVDRARREAKKAARRQRDKQLRAKMRGIARSAPSPGRR